MSQNSQQKKFSKQEITARFALLALGFIWGSAFVGVSSTAEFFQPAFLISMRFSISFVLLSLVFFTRFKRLDKKYLFASLAAGVTTFFGYYLQAFAMTSLGGKPGRTAFLISTYCVVVPFFSWLVNKKRPDRYNLIAAVMCVSGIALISLPDLISDAASPVCLADLVTLCSSLVFVLNIVAIERMAPKLDTILFTIAHFFVVAICAILFTALFENNSATVWSTQSISTVLYLAIPCTTVAMLLQTYGQKYTPASTASLFFSLESFFGRALSVLLGFEALTINVFLGGCLIVFAIVVTETKLAFCKIGKWKK